MGINGMLMSLNDTATLRSALNKKGIRLDVNFDPIDRIWNDRPELPSDAAFIHDEKYAGKSASDKLADLRRDFTTEGARAFFTSALDEIAWLLNLRSTDVPCNPVATSFLYVGEKDACLFINPAKQIGRAHV